MKKFIQEQLRKRLLQESVSDIKYHFTSIRNLENILNTNEIFLTPVFGTEADHNINDGKLFFLSLTSSRSLSVGYGTRAGVDEVVRLTMDGRAINHNLKTKRVDYWRRSKDPKDPMYSSQHRDDLYKTVSGSDELEDRVLSDSNTIGPATKLISYIEILNMSGKALGPIKKMTTELGIPLYVYDNEKYFSASVKSKAINVNDETPEKNEYAERVNLGEVSKILAIMFYNDPQFKEEVIDDLEKLGVTRDTIEKITEPELEKIGRIVSARMDSYYLEDFMNSLSAEIHNIKSNPQPLYRKVIYKLARDMKKHNCITTKQYFMYKGYIGKKTDDQFKEQLIQETFNGIDKEVMTELDYRKQVEYTDVATGDWYNDLFEKPSIKSFVDGTISKLKSHIKTTIMNSEKFDYLIIDLDNKDMLKYLDLAKDYDDPFWNTIDTSIEYDGGYIQRVIEVAVWAAANTLRERFYEMRDERDNQWRNKNQ